MLPSILCLLLSQIFNLFKQLLIFIDTLNSLRIAATINNLSFYIQPQFMNILFSSSFFNFICFLLLGQHTKQFKKIPWKQWMKYPCQPLSRLIKQFSQITTLFGVSYWCIVTVVFVRIHVIKIFMTTAFMKWWVKYRFYISLWHVFRDCSTSFVSVRTQLLHVFVFILLIVYNFK